MNFSIITSINKSILFPVFCISTIVVSGCRTMEKTTENLLAVVKTESGYGYIHTNGTTAVESFADYAFQFQGEYALVLYDNRFQLINRKGEKVMELDSTTKLYDQVDSNFVLYKTSPVSYVIQTNEKEPIKEVYQLEQKGLWSIRENIKYSFTQFEHVGDVLSENRIAVAKRIKPNEQLKWGFADAKGNEVINCVFEQVQGFRENIAPVKMYEKWGYVDLSGEIIVPCIYDVVSRFSEGYAVVLKDGTYSLINKNAEELIRLPYAYVGNVYNERLIVCQDCKVQQVDEVRRTVVGGKFGIIDPQGAIILPIEFDYISDFREGVAIIRTEKGYNAVDISGKIIFSSYFDNLKGFKNGFSPAKLQNKWGVIDKKGKWVIKPMYQDIDVFE